jgi:protein-L-isoaspartate(D-aspartate) O-methyltransferase
VNSIDLAGVGMTSQRTRERLIQRLKDQGITNQRILDVFRVTPRHLFLDEALAHRAYEDTALPIGFSQTLSQPYIVARMTEILLSGGPLKKVLEIGTGSGFQATILAQLVDRVYSVERIEPLLIKYAPYDGIITTAAPQAIPDDLLHQLAPDGILVIPVGAGDVQDLRVLRRIGSSSEFDEEIVEQVKFVPLLGGLAQ